MLNSAQPLSSISELNAGGTGIQAEMVEVEVPVIKTYSHRDIMDMMRSASPLLSMEQINAEGTGRQAEIIKPTIH